MSIDPHPAAAKLLTLCDAAFVRRHAPAGTSHARAAVIDVIVRRNIARGRVTRLLRRAKANDPIAFLAGYVQRVADCHTRERAAWLADQQPDAHDGLYERLAKTAARVVRRLRPRYPDLSVGELANAGFDGLICRQGARRYPFDVPWADWQEDFLALCARELREPGISRRTMEVSLAWLDEESALAMASVCACGAAECDCLDTRIDARTRLARLRPANQKVADLWLQGFTVEDTARALGLSVPAVNNRRARIKLALRA